MNYVCTIGFFDGVHRGHQCLIQQVWEEARRRDARSLLITFDRHPRAVFAPSSVPALLTTAEEKMHLLRQTGVDDIHVLPFDRAMAALTAREFMQQVLKEQLGVGTLVIGYDHHFGRPVGDGFQDYCAYGREMGIDVVLARELEEEHVSSSAIRRALEAGDVGLAAHLLGRPYTWTGRVVHGHAVGRQLGFPTANLQATEPAKLLPARGAYAVYIDDSGLMTHQSAMLNIGHRPTLDNGSDTSVEAHIFDYEGDLYGQTLTLSFIARLREEQTFDNEEALAHQLQIDKQAALRALNTQPSTLNSQPSTLLPMSSSRRESWWIYILIFFTTQVTGALLMIMLKITKLDFFQQTAHLLAFSLLMANLLAILLFFVFRPKRITWTRTMAGLHGRKGRRSLLAFALAVPLTILVNLIQEVFFPDLPNFVGDETFKNLMFHPLGLLTVSVIGPVAEELLFRGGVQTDLSRRYSFQGWFVPIGLSAAFFALAHMNPAQMPIALLLGVLLGFAYWWTDSLVAPICIHIYNNSFASAMTLLFPEEDKIVPLLGGKEPAGILAIVCLFLVVLIVRSIQKEGLERA